ncbi:MAG TPA: radical SAM protein [Candidatus Polarisedimenticolaceae bacterium]|nr:radical SAM protein [Candidatus Polarisedimenticolaceae bacterium]
MIGALLRIPAYRLTHALGRPFARPINVTVSTTFRCNSRCLTCNVYERPVDELTVEEWDRAFVALGRAPVWFTFSGGEPFLRKDLADIIEAAWRRCRPKVVNIPTNGTYGDRVVAGVQRLSPILRGTELVINVSLDAVGERNDVIRGLPGDYGKATETFRRLKELRLPNLTVGLHSVISSHNVRDFPAIADTLMAMKPDQYIAEPAEERVELQTIGTGITPKPVHFEPAIAHLEGRLRNGSGDGLPRLTRAIRLVYYGLARRTLRENRQVIPCYAGIASVHLAANGDVWGCCTKARPLGNLRKNGFDFDAIWRSQEARDERADIKAGNCACPLANAAYTSILCDAGALVQVGKNLVRPGKGTA